MTELLQFVATLKRPRLLLRAARIGMAEYNRTRVLKRVAPTASGGSAHNALQALIPVEEALEDARTSGDSSYVPSRHVEVLIALLAELRLASSPT